jgi:hypothetical protein
MTTQFKREERYYVLKISDMKKYLSAEKQESVIDTAGKLNAGRAVDGKPVLQAVVIESDWPEYERVWQMLETRMTTTQHQPFNPNDDRRFWPVQFSQVKGRELTQMPHRWKCSCGTIFWVRVNESHCPRCGKKCQMLQAPVVWPEPKEHPPLYADEDPEDQVRAARYRTRWNDCLEKCKAATQPKCEQLPPEQVNCMTEKHALEGENRYWYVIGLTDGETAHGIKGEA